MMNTDLRYMERALQIARLGAGNASPNPMVGAVIVAPDGEIIGEGFHRRCGEGHAEVCAVASVRDERRLADSTMYVSLEPCSHYGKTPPCAKLIIDNKIPRVVVGCLDPFVKVSGRGVAMLREAGVEVEVLSGEIAERCRRLNRRFMTAHTHGRPFVTLKWAQSADGYMDHLRAPGQSAMRFSTPLTSLEVHRLRSLHDAIMVGSGTVIADNPRLDVRGWHGRSPRRVVLDGRGRLTDEYTVMQHPDTIHITGEMSHDLKATLTHLYSLGITSVLVEGGPTLLSALIREGLWDTARVEVSPICLGDQGIAPAPSLGCEPVKAETADGNTIYTYDIS